jgi:EAL and modified HD-GYP domain-containing signal transduction protein
VASIRQALIMLGVDNVRRWATLTLVGSLEGKPSELTVTALVRARFCELSADALGLDSAQLFTLGLFSLIDAMLDLPLEGILAELPFPAVMQDALLHHTGPMGELVDAVAAMEGGYFGDAKALVDDAASHYVDALMWANDASGALFTSIRG